jgi:hypothetical protein
MLTRPTNYLIDLQTFSVLIMPWNLKKSADFKTLEIEFSGVITAQELSEVMAAAIDFANSENIFLILADCTAMTENKHSVFDLYFLADVLIANNLGHKIKEALVLPMQPDLIEDIKFWEITCFNRGIKVRVFNSREQALQWLLE